MLFAAVTGAVRSGDLFVWDDHQCFPLEPNVDISGCLKTLRVSHGNILAKCFRPYHRKAIPG